MNVRILNVRILNVRILNVRILATLAAAAALMTAVGPRLAAQTPRAEGPQRLAERLDRDTYASVLAVLDTARADGLPTEPLVQKALEGSSRGASGARITAAVSSLAARMRAARAALGTGSTEAELVAGAGALYLGVAPGTLTRLRRAESGPSIVVPLVVLTDVIAQGVPRDTATAVILSLAEARVSGEAFTRLRSVVADDIRAGAAPAAAVSMRARGILLGVRSSPAERSRSP